MMRFSPSYWSGTAGAWRVVCGLLAVLAFSFAGLQPWPFAWADTAANQGDMRLRPRSAAWRDLGLTDAEHAWLDAHPVIRIAGPRAFPPFQYVDAGGRIAGMASGYIALVQDRLGIRVEPLADLAWPEVLERARNRDLDVITCAARSSDREAYLLFSTPYLSFPMVIVTRKDAGFLSGITDLHNTTVAVVAGTSTHVWMERDQIGILPYIVDSPLQGLQAVSLGRADAYVGNLASISYQIEHEGLANLKVAAPTPYGNYDLHFAVRSDWPEFLSILNKTLASIQPEEHSAIRQRWIAVRYEYGIDPAMLWRIGLGAGFVVILLLSVALAWNWQVQRSEERFRGLLEYGADMILACRADGTIVYQSPSFTPLLGYPANILLNTDIRRLVHADDAPTWQRAFEAVTRSVASETVLHRLRHSQGRYLYVESHLVNLLDTRAVRAIVVNARDLTDHVTTEQALQHARDDARDAQKAAESANIAKSAFLANMSHELRTPLNAILGFSQLLMRSRGLTAEQQQSLEIINHSGEHLLSLINDVLNMSKIEAGRMTAHAEPMNLYDLLRDLDDMFRLPARQKGVSLSITRTPDVPQYLVSDSMKLRQIFLNLLSNAIKFTDEGGVALHIETRPLPPGSRPDALMLRCTVADTGVGIAEHDRERLFEPFMQTTQTGQKASEGTGLGLPISQRFVRLLGGELTLQSELGRGSVFTCTIMATVVSEEALSPSASRARRVVGLKSGQPAYRLLVVDDQWESRHLLASLLGPLGFEVEQAGNGQEALERVQRRKPHLIWMDMRMPVMDGYEATRRIRQLDARLPIIALTASSFEEERIHILKAGCDDFLRKPVKEFEIFDMLQKHLGIEFEYADTPDAANAASAAAIPEDVLLHEIQGLPEPLARRLAYMVEGIDLEGTRACISEIRALHPDLADALDGIVTGYRFDVLQRMLQDIAPEPGSKNQA